MPVERIFREDRGRVYLFPEKLAGLEGAREAVKILSTRKKISTLVLSYNAFGDIGCIALLEFLAAVEGQRHPVNELEMKSVGMEDAGLAALSEYIRVNRHFRQISIQCNNYGTNPATITAFTEALNTSCITDLQLNVNPFGPTIVPHFINALRSTSLRTLQLSMMELTDSEVPPLAQFIRSPRCRLSTLRVNGNNLTMDGLTQLVDALPDNFSLIDVEYHANVALGVQHTSTFANMDLRKHSVLARNNTLRLAVTKEAVNLLRCSRILLLASGDDDSSDRPSSGLPTEVILHILSHLAPTLSQRQRLLIFNHASNRATLVGAPSSSGAPAPKGRVAASCYPCECARCSYTGFAKMCTRDAWKTEWLGRMHCHSYDPDDTNQGALAISTSDYMPEPVLSAFMRRP